MHELKTGLNADKFATFSMSLEASLTQRGEVYDIYHTCMFDLIV